MKSGLILALVILGATAFSLSDITDFFYETVQVPGISLEQLEKMSEAELAGLKGIARSKRYDAVQDCTNQLAVECAFDIEKTVVHCAAAFESEGANIVADLKCAKDLLADKKTCWPCICYEAQKKGWHVIGC